MCLGVEPKGIIGSGYFTGPPEIGQIFEGGIGETALYAPIEFDTLLRPIEGKILSVNTLKANFPDLHPKQWTPQSSGPSLPESVASKLEILWRNVLKHQKIAPKPLLEGSLRRVVSNQRERSLEARRQCIEHYGLNCAVCDFNFGAFYGEIGDGLIHVHHLKPLSGAAGEQKVDPIKDLRPVCANCHQVIHARKEARTLDEVRQAIGRKTE